MATVNDDSADSAGESKQHVVGYVEERVVLESVACFVRERVTMKRSIDAYRCNEMLMMLYMIVNSPLKLNKSMIAY